MRIAVPLITLLAVAGPSLGGKGRLRLETVGEVKLAWKASFHRVRFGPKGRLVVVGDGQRTDRARDSWTRTGFRVIDLEEAKEAFAVGRVSLGRNLPVFSRDGRYLAWGDSREPGKLTVNVRRLADGETVRHEMNLPSREGFPAVAAIGNDATTVTIADPKPGGRDDLLLVRDLASGRELLRVTEFREPYHGRDGYEVVLTGGRILCHTRDPELASGSDYRLRMLEIETGKVIAVLGAYVSTDTPRFLVGSDGGTLYDGEGSWDIVRVDVETGERRHLGNVREKLYSHWLELTMAPDESRLVAWSKERRSLVLFDLPSGERSDLETTRGGRVLGFTPSGRDLLLDQWNHGVVALDLDADGRETTLIEGETDLVALDPTGCRLLTGEKTDEGWRLRVSRLTR
jgi:hypothetical protein